MERTAKLAVLAAACMALAFPFFTQASSVAPAGVAVPHSFLDVAGVPSMVDAGAVAPSTPVHIVVGLTLRDRAGLDAAIDRASQPGTPSFQHFLSQTQFDAQYGPTPASEKAVVDWLRQSGFRTTTFPNHLMVEASGTDADLGAATGTELHTVSYHGLTFHTTVSPAHVPSNLAGVVAGIDGLNDIQRFVPLHELSPQGSSPDGSVSGFTPADSRAFYDNPSAVDGSNQTVVIAGAFAWSPSDVDAYDAAFELPALPAGSGQVCSADANSSGCLFDSTNSLEVSLDVEMAHGTAPAARIVNYMASSPALPSFDVLYNRIVTDNPGHVVSTSWGICEEFWFEEEGLALSPVDENILANAAAIGQSWFAASGDSSILECPSPVVGAPFAPGALFPASSAYVVGVGGTSVFQCNTPNSSSGLFGTSYVPWDCNAYRPARGPLGSPTAVGPSEIPWALSGTGDSILVGQPLWQVGCGIQQIAGTRMVPDVSLLSDPSFPGYVVRHGGSWIGVGGTSAAAPQWGAFAAEEGQLAGGSLGLVGPRLYELCDTPALHAITTPGYAQPTGLGTPDVRALLGAYLGPSLTETQPYVVGNQGVTSFCSESLGLGSNCDALNECVGAAGENSQAACFYVAGQPRVALSAADDSGLTQSIQYQFYDPTISVVANGTVCGRGDIPVPPTAVLAQVSVGPLALAPDCLATLATAGTISLSN